MIGLLQWIKHSISSALDSGITGTPSIMTYSGLPSEYACEWATDAGLLGGGDATVVTTGPILFDGGVTTVISNNTKRPYCCRL